MMRCFLAVWIGFCAAAWADFYVAPNGNDAGLGTVEQPFATPARARDAVRSLKQTAGLPENGVTVFLGGGDYSFEQSFELTGEDSGEPGRPVTYSAAAGARPRLIGGRRVPPEAFGPVGDAGARDRLDAAVRDKVRVADLRALGFPAEAFAGYPDSFEEPPIVPELFLNDERMTVARWPDTDWAEIAEVVDSGPAPWRNATSEGTGTFVYSGDRPSRWVKAPAVWLQGYWCFDWSNETIRVGRIDVENRRITLSKPHPYGIGRGNPGPRRYFALNLLDELDRPGEYFLDGTGLLYFYPPGDLTGARIVVSTLRDAVIEARDASHVVLCGMAVETCAGPAIEVHGGAEVSVAGCVIRNTGKEGVIVDGGENHRVAGCDIYDIGTAGVKMWGGDRRTLRPSGHLARNNHIYRVSRRQRTHAYHVDIGGVGVCVSHNRMHDAPHQAIGLAGNDHRIEYNEIHHTGMETDDCGAFYMGRNPSERGTVLQCNYWHDIGSRLSHGSCAVYFDDGAGGQTVRGNVFVRACGGNFGAVFVHGGHDNVVENNIFIDCAKAMAHVRWDDDRWAKFLVDYRDRLVKEVDITRPPYTERYPDLKNYLDPASRPRFNTARRNIAYRCGKFSEGDWRLHANLFTDTDPGFVDADRGDYRLKKDAEALQKLPGFESIPFEQIGLEIDRLRPEIPK